ncbi:unnamed protein product [Parascedosporium putredinis]|uniref:Major facilitator superfamily (MFS) profile domain-containing protein n=1 Tax=Parascedosporium putredinis TaxID=1442378 RepID=A0A9P1H1G6_9PEZI|nr:unnamed protein product [Parascedosporium putredinis]CAI7993614.1 unnamed protein product [Parascedosporium putredinis]
MARTTQRSEKRRQDRSSEADEKATASLSSAGVMSPGSGDEDVDTRVPSPTTRQPPISSSSSSSSEPSSSRPGAAGTEGAEPLATTFLTGWRLVVGITGLLLCLYLVNLEVTIVSTSLVSITNDLSGFEKTNWVMTGYLITYTGTVIIWTKLSDVVGLKAALISTMVFFTAFSGGCGAAKTIDQLIIFRALQGVGAAGAYSLSILGLYEVMPREKLALGSSLVALSIALATLSGPLFGGVINMRTTWRWVFYVNVPAGILAIAMVAATLRTRVQTSPTTRDNSRSSSSSSNAWASLKRLDFLGAFLLLSGSLLLVTAVQETALEFSCWVAFFAWERHVTARSESGAWSVEPMFPWRLVRNRPWMGMLITTFVIGAPFNVAIVSLPQRFQVVSGVSALGAGVRLIPFSRRPHPPAYFVLLGAILDFVGVGLLSTLPIYSTAFPGVGYFYEVLTAARDIAVATGAIVQFRFLGGAIGLSIAANILNSALKRDLKDILDPSQLASLLVNIGVMGNFSDAQQDAVRSVVASPPDAVSGNAGLYCRPTFSALMVFKRGEQIRTVEKK